MLARLYEFFGVIGFDITPPTTFGELLPYLLTVFIMLGLVSAVFSFLRALGRGIGSGGRRL